MATEQQAMPDADRDDESGRYQETYPRAAFLEALADADGMAGTQDVTDAVGCSYELAYKKLRALEDEGTIASRKVGNARLWLLEDESALEDDDRDERDRVAAVVDDVAASWDDDERLADRKAAARAVLEYALESGEHISKSDAVDRFHDDHAVDGQNTETWWRQNVRPVLSHVGEHSSGRGYRVDPDRVDAIASGE